MLGLLIINSYKMSRLDLLTLFVLILSLGLVRQYLRGKDSDIFSQGLLRFTAAAEKQLADKPVPDVRNWRSRRVETIKTLNQLKQKLDNVCFYTNCAKAAGSGMGIICALTSFSASIMSLIGIPISLPILGAGASKCPAGYLTRDVSFILESILSRKYQNEFQAVLVKDKELSRSLNAWLELSENLEEEFQNIFGFDFKSENSKSFLMLREFHRLLILTKNFQKALDLIKQGKYSSFLDKGIGIKDLRQFSELILGNREISDKIQKHLNILSDLIEVSRRGFEIIYRNLRIEKVTMISSILDKIGIKIPPTIQVPTFLFLKVIDLANNVASFIDATKIVRDGKCPYSDGLTHIIDLLKMEQTIIESNFNL